MAARSRLGLLGALASVAAVACTSASPAAVLPASARPAAAGFPTPASLVLAPSPAAGASPAFSPAPAAQRAGRPVAAVTPPSAHVSAAPPCTIFPPDDVWHAAVSSLPVNPSSATWIASMNPSRALHPDWGDFNPDGYGIPVNVIAPGHAASSAIAFQYASESDPGPYAVGADLHIEGGPRQPSGGDQHMIAFDATACTLQELWDASVGSAPYSAGSGAKWNLRSDALRPDGWTSADAAGLPILPGLVQFDEAVTRGVVDHAIRFTVSRTDRAHIWPARHDAGSASDPSLPPMGARFRLKASFDISSFDPVARVVLQAMKTYGMILADNGSDWYFQGSSDDRWAQPYRNGNSYIDQLVQDFGQLHGSDFEAVDESGLMIDANSGAAR